MKGKYYSWKCETCGEIFRVRKNLYEHYKEYPNQVREIKEFKMIKKGNIIKFRITGDGFLRNMVRIIIGSLIDNSLEIYSISNARYN